MLYRIIFRLVSASILVFILYFSWLQVQWSIGGVEINKNGSHLSEGFVSQVLSPYIEETWVSVDIDGIKNDLLMEPWVESVDIRRVFPDKIRVDITEKEAVAVYGYAGLISSKGQVFQPDVMPDVKLPRIDMLEQDIPEGFKAFELLQMRVANIDYLPQDIEVFSYTSVNGWYVKFADGLSIYFGRGDFSHLLQKFLYNYPKVLQARKGLPKISRFDMRYPKGAAIS